MKTVVRCPSCGTKVLTFENYSVQYKSPIKQCRQCGSDYLDPRCVELAGEPFPDRDFKLYPYLVMTGFGAFLLWRGIHLSGMRVLGEPEETQWFLPTMFIIAGAGMILASIIGMIYIKSGLKAKKYKRLYDESLERMSDKYYVRTLGLLGYPVPEQFREKGEEQ